jgi:hypothetical protein
VTVIAYEDRSTRDTLCPTCAAGRYPLAFPVRSAPDAELERLGEIHAHDLDPDDSCPCAVCGEDLSIEWDGDPLDWTDDCPDCTESERCDNCERSYGPIRG